MRTFEFSSTNKRYHTFDYYVKKTFGEKVVKVGLDGGFTCPNRDGTKGFGGCAFCAGGGGESMPCDRNEGADGESMPCDRNEGDTANAAAIDSLSPSTFRKVPPLRLQYEQGRARLYRKWGRCPTIAYFQNYTSTYAPTARLQSLFEEALSFEDVVGLTVATRPDCLPRQVLDYLSRLHERTHLTVELGLQTTFDETALRINRGHLYSEFLSSYNALKERGIRVTVHLIDGLPGESREMMLENARRVAALRPDFVKIHCLYYRKGSALTEEYLAGALSIMEREAYLELLADQIELMPKETVIERITGDADRKSLVAPAWSLDKIKVINGLDMLLEKRQTTQGSAFHFVQDAQNKR